MLDLVVDAEGEVTSVRPVSFAMRNDGTGLSVSATDVKAVEELLAQAAARGPSARRSPSRTAPAIIRDLDLMLKAASSSLMQWRFEPPAAAPAIARCRAQFDLAAGRVTTGTARPISGFAGAPDR